MTDPTIISSETLLVAMILLIPLALIPATIAKRKGRSFLLWYLFGYGFFLIALIMALLLLPQQQQQQDHFAEVRDMAKEREYQDVIVTSSRITDCYVGSPVDALSYQIIKNRETRKLQCKVNLFSNNKIEKLEIKLTIYNYLNEILGKVDFTNYPFREVVELDITDYPQATAINFDYDNVVLESGQVWHPTGPKVKYEIDMVDSHHLEELKQLTNKYAFCYPQEYDDYWVCSCSKANNGDTCVLCGISKAELFSKMSQSKIHEMKNEEKIRKNLEDFQASQAEKMLYREE